MIPTKGGKKRPVTAGFQFKNSMQTLLTALYSCQPHYIRCIKPNDDKKALQFHDMKVIEQTRYLGILENLRVRRAGYCYRQTYEKWFNRYYMLSDKTFPKSKIGDNFKKGIEFLIEQLGLPKSEYQYGKTKIFIRTPHTLFDIEAKRLISLNRIATKIQKVWRAWQIRKIYLQLKKEAIDIFKGQKERTRQSIQRGVISFFGDFLGLQDNNEIKLLISKYGDTKIVFSDLVKKVNKRYKFQDRILLLTDKSIYNLKKFNKPKKNCFFECKRQISLKSIESISVSKLSDNFFVIHVPSEYDYVYENAKKTIFITLLNNEFKKSFGKPLPLHIVQSIQFKIKKGQAKYIQFSKDEMSAQAKIKKEKGKLQIQIASGVNPNFS
jgi:myosin-1